MMTNKALPKIVILLLLGFLSGADASSVNLVPTTAVSRLDDGDIIAFDLTIDFSDEEGTLGGGLDIVFDPAALGLVSVTGAGLGDPAFGRNPDVLDGLLQSWAVGDFNAVGSAPGLVGSVRFEVLPAMGPKTVVRVSGTNGIGGPWVSGRDFVTLLTPVYNQTDLVRGEPPPAAPSGVNASDGTFPDRVRVTFNLVDGATIHRIFRCLTTELKSCGSPVGLSKTGVFDDREAVPGTVYFYRVHACIPAMCGPLSVADAGHSSTIPAAPTGVTASDGAFELKTVVSWDAMEGVNGFRVFRCSGPDSGTCGTAIGFSTSNHFDDPDGVADKIYWYRVKACAAGQCSVFSEADEGYRGEPEQDVASTPVNRFISFDDDGKDDVLLRNSETGRWLINFMNWRNVRPNSGITPLFANPDWEMMGTGDFNGDGRGDVVLRNSIGGGWWIYLMNGRLREGGAASITRNLDWVLAGIDDFDGDGKDDVLLRNLVNGQWQINFMDSWVVRDNSGRTPLFTSAVWEMNGTGDFNDDSRGDVLLRNRTTGAWWIYLMNGRARTGGAAPITRNSDWMIAGIDDFDGDGKDDVLLRHTVTGLWQINFMDSWSVRDSSGLTPLFTNLNWEMQGSGDFNDSGRGDVLLRNRNTGRWWIFLMNGRVVNSGTTKITMDLAWKVSRFKGAPQVPPGD